jgi:hypothetical protein
VLTKYLVAFSEITLSLVRSYWSAKGKKAEKKSLKSFEGFYLFIYLKNTFHST